MSAEEKYSDAFWSAFKRGDYDVLRTSELKYALERELEQEHRNPFHSSRHKDRLMRLIQSRRGRPGPLDHLDTSEGAGAGT